MWKQRSSRGQCNLLILNRRGVRNYVWKAAGACCYYNLDARAARLKEEIFGGKGNKLEMMKRFCVFADAPREVLNYIYKGARRPQIINFPLFPFNYVMRARERGACDPHSR
jgi:hypothetical protein